MVPTLSPTWALVQGGDYRYTGVQVADMSKLQERVKV